MANYVAQDIDHSIRSRLELIDRLAADLAPSTLEQPDRLAAWLKDRQRINPLFSGLLVIKPDGHRLLASWPALLGQAQLDYADIEWFRAALKSDRAVIGTPTHGRLDGTPLMFTAQQVRNSDGQTVAVLAGFSLLDAPGFLDSLQKTRLGASGGFLLISPSDKLFVASSDPSMVLTATPPVGVNPLHDRAMLGYRGTGVTTNAKGVEEIAAFVSVPSTGWFVVARMPTEEAFHPIATMRDLALKGTLAILLLMTVLVTVFLSVVLRPLVEVGRAMREMASGTRALAQLPVRRSDEVGDMVLAFNRLVAALHEKEATLKNTLEKLDHLAGTDTLTGAWNRRQFDEVLEWELDRATRHGHPISLILLDLDLFKHVNDDYGHAKGDQVLRDVADCIRAELRKSDSLTRWGGEEFMILMPNTQLSNALVLAERLRACIAAQSTEKLCGVTASIGVAEFDGSETAEQWVARADAAMYVAKNKGRNRVEVNVPTPHIDTKKTGLVQLIWREHFCGGNRQLDAQHRGLFDDCNNLLDMILSGSSRGEIESAIDAMLRNIVSHFCDEEKLFMATDYTSAAEHRRLHAALADRAAALIDQFKRGEVQIGALFQFLARDLVANHILREDRAFFPYLRTDCADPDFAQALPIARRQKRESTA
ncbi:MAG: diguanylate cyclase [Burkholderiaceae bacterium]|nr:diguanylate cyclase [Burkholderiaceae bacterium]